MINISDAEIIPRLLRYMDGKCVLDGITLADDILYYMTKKHNNYLTESGIGFICVTEHEGYVSIPYIYSDMKIATHKELIAFAKSLYKCYTIDNKKPIYYTGLKNLYPNHSIEVAYNLWQFVPKD